MSISFNVFDVSYLRVFSRRLAMASCKITPLQFFPPNRISSKANVALEEIGRELSSYFVCKRIFLLLFVFSLQQFSMVPKIFDILRPHILFRAPCSFSSFSKTKINRYCCTAKTSGLSFILV